MKVEIDPQKELVRRALDILSYEDSHPNVGMGMGWGTAIEYALKDMMDDYNVDCSTEVDIDAAFESVKKARRQ